MAIRPKLRKLIERVTGRRIFRHLPRGLDPCQDIVRFLPACRIVTVFDVGANIGQSALEYLACFPKATIYCFEPASATFDTLRANLRGFERTKCLRIALGANDKKGRMEIHGICAGTNCVVRDSEIDQQSDSRNTEEVAIQSLDGFCAKEHVDKISLLKIDTEGYDLEVLRGSEQMLRNQRVQLVQVEAGMNTRNTRHVPIEALKAHMEARGFFVFGIYEQTHELFTGEPFLRRANVMFVSERVALENKMEAWKQ